MNFDEHRIDEILNALDQCHLPGAVVGIAIDGTPVYRKGFGLAHMELAQTLSPNIRMRIGATSNQFASFAYLLLCECGLASLDDTLGLYLPELQPITCDVTLRQLMTHTSGLRDVFALAWQLGDFRALATSKELLDIYRHIDDCNAPPGQTWIYNNGGYLLLSAVIERITDQPLEDVLRERIFDPVGMSDTMLRRSDKDFVCNSATLHPWVDGRFEKSIMGTCLAGEGGIVSTVNDMLKWLRSMDTRSVGSAASWGALASPERLRNGHSTGYGLGLMSDTYRGVEILWHIAGVWGGSAQVTKVPRVGLDMVVFVNRGDLWAGELTEEILDACCAGLAPRPEPAQVLPATGVFHSTHTNRCIQLYEIGGRQYGAIDGFDVQLAADQCGVLWPVGVPKYLKQGVALVGDTRKPDCIRLSDFGNEELLPRRPEAAGGTPPPIMGRYKATIPGFEARISDGSEGMQLQIDGPFGCARYSLECIAEKVWRARPAVYTFYGGVLTFDVGCNRFYYTAERTRSLPFSRIN